MSFTPNFAGIINALKYIIENGIAGSGGGGGGGGITQAQVQAAIQAASNIDELEVEIKKLTALINASKISVDIGNTGTVGASVTNFPVIQIVGGITTDSISAFYTRPADTTAYTINDAVSNSITAPSALNFNSATRTNGGSGYITNAICTTNQISFNGNLRLHLFKGSAAPNATNDNSPYALLNSNNANRIGYIDFASFQTGGTGSDTALSFGAMPQGRNLPFTSNAANSNIYGLLETRNAFAHISSQTFTFYLGIEQN